ncbi:MFS transporter [Streptomyces sp. NPDC055103]
MTPAGLSIITTGFEEGPQRNKALLVYSGTAAGGFSIGLVVGGLLAAVDWRWVFFAPVVLTSLILVAALALFRSRRAPTAPARASTSPGRSVSRARSCSSSSASSAPRTPRWPRRPSRSRRAWSSSSCSSPSSAGLPRRWYAWASSAGPRSSGPTWPAAITITHNASTPQPTILLRLSIGPPSADPHQVDPRLPPPEGAFVRAKFEPRATAEGGAPRPLLRAEYGRTAAGCTRRTGSASGGRPTRAELSTRALTRVRPRAEH